MIRIAVVGVVGPEGQGRAGGDAILLRSDQVVVGIVGAIVVDVGL